jgi:hypothetical protein
LAPLFYGHKDESRAPFLELSAPSQSGLLTANPCLINLYLAAEWFPSRIHRRSAGVCEASSTRSRNKTIGGAVGSPVHTIFRARIEGK